MCFERLVACFQHCIESSKAGIILPSKEVVGRKAREKLFKRKKLVKKRQLVDNYRIDSSGILVIYGQVRYFFL